MFRQFCGLFSDAEKELALKRITNSRRQNMVSLLAQSMGKPIVVVPSASKEESSFASKEELQFASKEESLFASKEESSFLFALKEEPNKRPTP